MNLDIKPIDDYTIEVYFEDKNLTICHYLENWNIFRIFV